MYDSVLVPTDGSAAADVALDHAIGVAKRNDASLHSVYVTEIGNRSEQLDEEMFSDTVDRIEQAGQAAVEEMVERARAEDIDTTSAVLDGTPAETIVTYAKNNDIEIIVMATRGHTGETRDVMGSVTDTVIRSTSIPVLAINADV